MKFVAWLALFPRGLNRTNARAHEGFLTFLERIGRVLRAWRRPGGADMTGDRPTSDRLYERGNRRMSFRSRRPARRFAVLSAATTLAALLTFRAATAPAAQAGGRALR